MLLFLNQGLRCYGADGVGVLSGWYCTNRSCRAASRASAGVGLVGRSTLCVLLFGLLHFVGLVSAPAFAVTEGLAAVNSELVSQRRVGRMHTEYTFTIQLANAGGALTNVAATVASLTPNTLIVDGVVTVEALGAGATVRPSDTYTIRQNRRFRFDPSQLVWSFAAETANNPPVAAVAAVQRVPVGTIVQLDGSGSSDADGDALAFRWSLVGPAGSNPLLSSTSAVAPTFVADAPGTFVATLVVDDGITESLPVGVAIEAQAANTPPIADAGGDQTVAAGALVTLSGRGSSDADGDALTYAWTLLTPPGSTAALSAVAAPEPVFLADLPGRYEATLIVNDGQAASVPATVVVTARVGGDSSPAIVTQPIVSASVATPYRYDVEAFDPDVGDVLTYSLTLAPDGMSIDPATGLISWVPANSGAFDVDVLVTDSTGRTGRQLYLLSVDRGAGDQPPVLEPIADQRLVVGTRLVLTALAMDPEGDRVRFSLANAPEGMAVNSATGVLAWRPGVAQLGAVMVTVSATDLGGQQATTSFTVVVEPERENSPPSIAAVADRTLEPLTPLTLTLQASDENAGDILRFSLTGAPTRLQLDPASGLLNWLPDASDVGTRTVTAMVTDSFGATASTSFRITVSEPNLPPTAVDDAYIIDREQRLRVAAPGVLENDEEPNGDTLSAATETVPTLGELLAFPGDGGFEYEPPSAPVTYDFGLRERCRGATNAMWASPMVGDVDGDGRPEIVGVSPEGFTTRLYFLDPATCALDGEMLTLPFQTYGVFATNSPPALVNLDADPALEIVLIRQGPPALGINRARLIALNGDGSFVWSLPDGASEALASPIPNTGTNYYAGRGATVADLDSDGTPELLMTLQFRPPGAVQNSNAGLIVAYNADGTVRWEHVTEAQTGGDPDFKPLLLVDLDLDGSLEVIYHTSVVSHEGTLEFLLQSDSDTFGRAPHLTVAVANFDNDPFPELIARDVLNYYLFEHTGGTPTWTRPSRNSARGDITIADFDGDGEPEFVNHTGVGTGTNAAWLTLFDTDGTELWTHEGTAYDSPATELNVGRVVTAFDFDQDGADELVTYMVANGVGQGIFVFRGSDGVELAHYTGDGTTPHNVLQSFGMFPTIVDADRDGAAEVLYVPGTNFGGGPVVVLEGLEGHPAPPARPLRNQLIYQPTHVNADGSIPPHPRPQWLVPGLNGFHQTAVVPFEEPIVTDRFSYRASDGAAQSNEAIVELALTNTNAPTIVSTPVPGGSPGFLYRYGAFATDADFGDLLQWTLVDGPGTMTITGLGVVEWTPNASDLGPQRVQLVVTDLQGNSHEQTYLLTVTEPVAVPSVSGGDETSATAALAAAGLSVGRVTTAFDRVVPAGAVISQSVAAGATSPSGAPVDLIVSLGPPPSYVPELGQLGLSAAAAQLEAVGLSLGAVTDANSDVVPRGLILAQAIPAGTQVDDGTAVAVIRSGGPALTVDLPSRFLAPGTDVPVAVVVRASDGTPLVPQPPVSLTVEAEPGAEGSLPGVSDALLTIGVATRGAFTLVVDAGSGGVVREDFLVRGDPLDAYFAPFVELATTLDESSAVFDALVEAIAANDLLAMASLGAELRVLRDKLDLALLAERTPFAPEEGFWPTVAQAVSLGFSQSFGESDTLPFLYASLASELDQSLSFLVRLDPLVARDDDVRARALNDALDARVALFNSGSFSPGAMVRYRTESYRLLSRQVPELLHANLSLAVQALEDAGLLAATPATRRERYAATPGEFYAAQRPAFFSLIGLMSASSIRSKIISKIYFPHVKRIVASGLLLQQADALVGDPAAQDLVALISGASVSFHNFLAPDTVVEGFFESDDPLAYQAAVIGPDAFQAALDALTNLASARNPLKFSQALDEVKRIGESSAAGYQLSRPHETLRGCLFDANPDCSQLVIGDGFKVVHSSGAFPAPVLVIITDTAALQTHAGVFAFFPN